MIAEAFVEAGPQGDLVRDRSAHGATSNFVGETFMEHIEFLVGLVELHSLRRPFGIGAGSSLHMAESDFDMRCTSRD